MNFTEGFGKKWIDRILGKVDKDQGVANAGKVLGIGNDGQVVPVAQSGGGSGSRLEDITGLTIEQLLSKVKVGDDLVLNLGYKYCSGINAPSLTPVTVGDVTHLAGDMAGLYSQTSNTFFATVRYVDSSAIYLTPNPIVYNHDYTLKTINDVQYPLIIMNIVYLTAISSTGITTTTRGLLTLGGNNGVIPRVINVSATYANPNISGSLIHNS